MKQIQINHPLFQDIIFQVLDKISFPVATQIPSADPTQLGRPQMAMMVRDVYLCSFQDIGEQRGELVASMRKLVQCIGSDLFTVPPEMILCVVAGDQAPKRVPLGSFLQK